MAGGTSDSDDEANSDGGKNSEAVTDGETDPDSTSDGDADGACDINSAAGIFKFTIRYNAYETMTGEEGARGEKGSEYKYDKEYWRSRLDPFVDSPPEFVQIYAGGSCSEKYSTTRWECEGVELVDLRSHQEPKFNYTHNRNDVEGTLALGPYSTGFAPVWTVDANEPYVYAIRLGVVVGRHYTKTDRQTHALTRTGNPKLVPRTGPYEQPDCFGGICGCE